MLCEGSVFVPGVCVMQFLLIIRNYIVLKINECVDLSWSSCKTKLDI